MGCPTHLGCTKAMTAFMGFRLLLADPQSSSARWPPCTQDRACARNSQKHGFSCATNHHQSALASLPVRPRVAARFQGRASPLGWPPSWRSLLPAKLRCDVPELLSRPIADGCGCVSRRDSAANGHRYNGLSKMSLRVQSNTIHSRVYQEDGFKFPIWDCLCNRAGTAVPASAA